MRILVGGRLNNPHLCIGDVRVILLEGRKPPGWLSLRGCGKQVEPG
jgi:hypothetical protein